MSKDKEFSDLLGAVSRAKSHADWTAFGFQQGIYAQVGRMRVESIEKTLKDGFDALVKIRALAQQAGNDEILAIFCEPFEVLPVHL